MGLLSIIVDGKNLVMLDKKKDVAEVKKVGPGELHFGFPAMESRRVPLLSSHSPPGPGC